MANQSMESKGHGSRTQKVHYAVSSKALSVQLFVMAVPKFSILF